MPIYKWECKECGTTMEVIQKFDDPAPICGCGFEMRKQITTCNFKLNGGGWYKDGYSNKKIEKSDSSSSTDKTIKAALSDE